MISNQPTPQDRWDSGAENVTSEDPRAHEHRRQEVVEHAAAEQREEQDESGVEEKEPAERQIAEGSTGSGTGESTRLPH